MGTKQYCTVSGTLFALVALAHLFRIINGLPVTAGDAEIPMFASWVGLVVPAALAIWAFRLASASGQPR